MKKGGFSTRRSIIAISDSDDHVHFRRSSLPKSAPARTMFRFESLNEQLVRNAGYQHRSPSFRYIISSNRVSSFRGALDWRNQGLYLRRARPSGGKILITTFETFVSRARNERGWVATIFGRERQSYAVRRMLFLSSHRDTDAFLVRWILPLAKSSRREQEYTSKSQPPASATCYI